MRKLQYFIFAIVTGLTTAALAQTTNVSGTVTDDQDVPLPGASVVVKGTTNGVMTDFDGNFTISLDSGQNTLQVSYVGFDTSDVVLDGSSHYYIKLTASMTDL